MPPWRSTSRSSSYVTNIPTTNMNGAAIVAAYRDLYEVERSFRMAKSDLGARPIFHHQRDSIDAHLTIVLAALPRSWPSPAKLNNAPG
jgi:transposase